MYGFFVVTGADSCDSKQDGCEASRGGFEGGRPLLHLLRVQQWLRRHVCQNRRLCQTTVQRNTQKGSRLTF